MEKKCTKCGEVKDFDEFSNAKKGKHGKDSRCRTCVKEYREANKEKIKQYRKEYYKNNKEKEKKRRALYRKKNKDKILLYLKKNKRKKLKYSKKYLKERRKTDPLFKLSCGIVANIRTSLINKGYKKKMRTHIILKCDYDFFMNWLNGFASNGYTYGIGDLHLDHVVPISLAQTEDELLLLNHYSNFQLLTAFENLAKSNRYVNPTNLKRVLEHHPEPNKIKEIYSRL